GLPRLQLVRRAEQLALDLLLQPEPVVPAAEDVGVQQTLGGTDRVRRPGRDVSRHRESRLSWILLDAGSQAERHRFASRDHAAGEGELLRDVEAYEMAQGLGPGHVRN